MGGSWIDTVTVELDPLDAGTDNGFTFTAPNWPTAPQGVIYRITSRYPGHPAGSFYYPKSKRLPPIATFQFIKVGKAKPGSWQQEKKRLNKLINSKLAVKMPLPPLGATLMTFSKNQEPREKIQSEKIKVLMSH